MESFLIINVDGKGACAVSIVGFCDAASLINDERAPSLNSILFKL
jgi:hypothetical protein